MKRLVRLSGLFLSAMLMASQILPFSVSAASSAINTSAVSAGYFTVNYTPDAAVKMKVGVTQGAETVYYDYVPGTAATYALTAGSGAYTITLYRNTTGTSYQQVESTQVDVAMADALAPYLVSTSEVMFSSTDSVGQKAAELCAGLTSDAEKVAAIHNYIASSFTYDNAFAAQVESGAVKNYIPDTNRTLAAQTGICYDFSALFAAMCRSQGIPCAIAKGYLSGTYHAWNMVYVDGAWNAVDMTRSISYQNTQAVTLSDCVTALDGYTGMSF